MTGKQHCPISRRWRVAQSMPSSSRTRISITSGRYRPDAAAAAGSRFYDETDGPIGDALLHNSVNVMTREREEVGVIYPLFTHRETERATHRWSIAPWVSRSQWTVSAARSGRTTS